MQTQGSTTQKSKPKESRCKDLKLANKKTSAPLCTNELEKTSHQDKKKKYFKKKRDWKNSTPVIGDNAIKNKKKWNNQGNKKCYNCQKKGHLARNCPEPLKN